MYGYYKIIQFWVCATYLQESYQNVKRWLDDVEKYSSERVYKVMVGNKADLENKRAIQYTQAKVW